MAPLLIIGYGNVLRGDDGAGRQAAEELMQQYGSDERVRVISAHQLNPEMAKDIASALYVIFIDATADPLPDHVACNTLGPRTHGRSFTHQVDPAGLLSLSLELYGRCPEASLITIAGESFAYEQGLTVKAREGVSKTLEFARALITKQLTVPLPERPILTFA